MKYKTDLSVRIGSIEFKNPVIPASGAYDYFENNANLFPMDELGAIMIKSVHRFQRKGNPQPRIVEVCGGMINAVGIPSKGIEYFMEHEIEKYPKLNTPVILSISGNEVSHYVESLDIIDNDERITAIEVNLSCPNVGTGLAFSVEAEVLSDILSKIRPHSKLPLFAKLSPNAKDIRISARISEEEGMDAITLCNTFRAMKIDIKTKKPALGNISGGLSGPGIKAQNMFNVWSAYDQVKIPIIASGGICSYEDAIEYILAGATMVEVGSMNFVNPMVMPEIIEGIDGYLYYNGYNSIYDIRGIAHEM